jgi:hypothetical protein
MSVTQLRFEEAHCNCPRGIAVAPSRQGTTQPFSRGFWGMSLSLLNIEKRRLPRLTLRGVGLAGKGAVS